MNNPSFETVVIDVENSSYAPLFIDVFGESAFDDSELAFEFIAEAIAAYERSNELNAFTSKYDFFQAGQIELSPKEQMGLTLFTGKAKCVHCHQMKSLVEPMENDLFTNHKYANIGLGKNPNFPFDLMPPDSIDLGLGAITGNAAHNGKFKTPHLRNISETAPYMHNGLFNTLKEVVHFYNTRDTHPHVIPPEVPENMIFGMVGDLGLLDEEIEAIVEFLETLTDDWQIKPKSVVINNSDDEDDDD